MRYHVEQDNAKRESFGHYWYRIYQDGRIIAHYWHDYRGDEHGIVFADGREEPWPVGRMVDFLEGGGPQSLRLSARAIRFLQQQHA